MNEMRNFVFMQVYIHVLYRFTGRHVRDTTHKIPLITCNYTE